MNTILKNIKLQNAKKIVIGHLNINSIKRKFEALKEIVKGNIDILIRSVTKIDNTFPISEFIIKGYNDIRVNTNKNGGGLIIYIREEIPCKVLNVALPCAIEGWFVELNLHESNGLYLEGTIQKKYIFLSFLMTKCVISKNMKTNYT